MSVNKRNLPSTLSESKPELLIQAEAVVRLLHWLQVVAPEVWSENLSWRLPGTIQQEQSLPGR